MSVDSKIYADLEFRGLIKQVTSPELGKKLNSEKMTVYVGFDPTADSLHIGHLLPLFMLRRLQQAGHQVIAVIGGATGMIGDPSFKAQERPLLDEEQLRKNQAGITRVISKFLDTQGSIPALVVNNYDWMKNFSFLDFLRDVGKHFTVNYMMAKESVRARLEDREHGISYTEFTYMLLQAYDFYHLHQKHGCNLQVGGSDQWGNITAGTELIRRIRAHAAGQNPDAEEAASDSTQGIALHAYGLSMPLVMKADGTKFGKTESGAVWLSPDKTSPYELYQFLVQTPDSDVGTLLRYFTFFLDHAEITRLEISVKTAPEKREAQTTLARELTKLIHGEEAVTQAMAATQALFGSEIKSLDRKTLLSLFSGAPTAKKAKSELGSLALIDVLAETGLCPSKGQARKDVQAGGVYLNNERISDVARVLAASDLIADFAVVLRKGKKNYQILDFS